MSQLAPDQDPGSELEMGLRLDYKVYRNPNVQSPQQNHRNNGFCWFAHGLYVSVCLVNNMMYVHQWLLLQQNHWAVSKLHWTCPCRRGLLKLALPQLLPFLQPFVSLMYYSLFFTMSHNFILILEPYISLRWTFLKIYLANCIRYGPMDKYILQTV